MKRSVSICMMTSDPLNGRRCNCWTQKRSTAILKNACRPTRVFQTDTGASHGDAEHYKKRCSNLGSSSEFCLYPQGFFPQLGITAIVVPGTEIGDVDQDSARFIDNKRISGTITEMVEEALNFCRRNMKVKTIISKETGARTDKTEYPVDALREAILNAVIHRDYSIHTEGTPVQIDFSRTVSKFTAPEACMAG